MRAIRVSGLVLAFLWIGGGQVAAQQTHVTATEELEAAVTEHADAVEADREAIRSILERPEVQEIAEQHGIDLEQVEHAVGAMGADDLNRIASQARALDAAMQDRVGFSMSINALIVILALVILLVLIT